MRPSQLAYGIERYYGSIFRIGYEAIYVLFLTALAVIGLCVLDVGHSHARYSNASARDVLGISAGALAGLALWGPLIGPLLGRGPGRRSRVKSNLTELRRQVRWVDRTIILAAVAAAAVAWRGSPTVPHWLLVAPPGLAGALWAVRYHRGVRPAALEARFWRFRTRRALQGARRNPAGGPATVLLAIAATTMTVVGAAYLPARTVLSPGAAVGWAGALALAGILVYTRGHERSMLGSRGELVAWLQLHRGDLIDRYAWTGAAASSEQDRQAPTGGA